MGLSHNKLATGDASDEDGVVFSVQRGVTVYVANAPAGGKLDVRINFNRDGDFIDIDE